MRGDGGAPFPIHLEVLLPRKGATDGGQYFAALRTGWFPIGGTFSINYDSLTLWGKVLDASTGKPIRGVDVMEQSKEKSQDGLPICAHLAVTDTAGSYGFGSCERATIT